MMNRYNTYYVLIRFVKKSILANTFGTDYILAGTYGTDYNVLVFYVRHILYSSCLDTYFLMTVSYFKISCPNNITRLICFALKGNNKILVLYEPQCHYLCLGVH